MQCSRVQDAVCIMDVGRAEELSVGHDVPMVWMDGSTGRSLLETMPCIHSKLISSRGLHHRGAGANAKLGGHLGPRACPLLRRA